MGRLYVGLSGYAYPEWKGEGLFYPPTVASSKFLGYYASRYPALEANGTFTKMPSEATVSKWIAQTPQGFRISPKIHQNVTHRHRLKEGSYEVAANFVRAIEPLAKEGKLGPVLIQLPPNLKRNEPLLDEFLAALPQTESVRYAVEFRSDSWRAPAVEAILRRHGVGTVLAETDEESPELCDSGDSIFVRLRKLKYSESELDAWSERFAAWRGSGRDCYVYCRHLDTEAPWTWADRLLASA